MKDITLGSLFDGSGGFPLGGAHAGITPVWAAEIEPYPIAVSSLHFPQMKHLGDVSQIKGVIFRLSILLHSAVLNFVRI